MKIHEYQAKAILAQYNVPVPRGEVAFTVEEAEAAAKKIGGSVVVKAQIHAGGRGKGGGVKVAQGRCRGGWTIARQMIGMKLVTHQTGPEGRIVQRLLIEETLPIERELYLGIVLDRVQGKPVFMASAAGGMEIEEVAAKTPGADSEGDACSRASGCRRTRRASWRSASAFRRPAQRGAAAAMIGARQGVCWRWTLRWRRSIRSS